jgi:site-specific DNA recombinase
MPVVGLYIRVSDATRQGKGFSLKEQLPPMEAYWKERDWEIIVFEEQESASEFGEGLDRTKLNEMLQLARNKKLDAIMYYVSNRFTRDMADGIILRRELYKLGVKLYCYYPYPREITNDMEMLHVFEDYGSQQYVRDLREATMRGYRGKAKSGLYPAGLPPYGYVLEGKKQETRIIEHPECGKVVRRIYEEYTNLGMSLHQIAQHLTLTHTLTPGAVLRRPKKRGDTEWTSNIVLHVLRNPAYKGTWQALKYEGTKDLIPIRSWPPRDGNEVGDCGGHRPLPSQGLYNRHGEDEYDP